MYKLELTLIYFCGGGLSTNYLHYVTLTVHSLYRSRKDMSMI